jgi:hypothetical protein
MVMTRYHLIGNDAQIVDTISSEKSINELAKEHLDGMRVVSIVPVENTPEHVIPHHTGLEALDEGSDG